MDKDKEEYWRRYRLEKAKKWAEENRERKKEYMRQRYANDPEVRARNKARSKDPQRQQYMREYMRRYRARRMLSDNRKSQEGEAE